MEEMVLRCRSAPSMWWKSAQALNCGPDRHMCWPERAQKISRFSSSSTVSPPSLSWFPPMVYYYGIIASICLSSHRVDRNQEQKTVRVRKKKRAGGISLSNPNTSPPSPPLPSKSLIRPNQNAAESLSPFCPESYNSAWLLDSFMDN